MKTSTYTHCLNKIKLFCTLSKKGFIVAEINDIITKRELVDDLQTSLNISVIDLNALIKTNQSSACAYCDADVLLINEVACSDVESVVINLNYNRDWFLRLNKKIIFILPTITVSRLIEYSYSFWSFVYLHVICNTKFPSVISPHYISDILLYENNSYRIVEKGIYKKVYGTSKSATSLISNYDIDSWGIRDIDLNKVLASRLNRIDFKNVKSIEAGFESIFALGKSLLKQNHAKEALKCFDFLKKNFTLGDNQKPTYIDLEKNIIHAYYQLGEYFNALNRIINLFGIIYDDDQVKPEYSFLTPYDLAVFWNNAGVLLFLTREYKHAISMFNSAAELVNNITTTFHIGEILFNLSLVSLIIDDHKNAQYYINKAIEISEQFQNRSIKILCFRYKVLKSYILVNIGAIDDAKKLIKPSLEFLRLEIVESHEYIMEAHFVYALVYLHNDELPQAKQCAIKAYNISKKIKAPLKDRARISQLLGEILFYMSDYSEAKRFLYHACSQANIFSDEVVKWMNDTRAECEKKLAKNNVSN